MPPPTAGILMEQRITILPEVTIHLPISTGQVTIHQVQLQTGRTLLQRLYLH